MKAECRNSATPHLDLREWIPAAEQRSQHLKAAHHLRFSAKLLAH
jgi:hypothetical protein